jgi:ectoine hydroxylase-related dioxygenase (phytanoyl-CoA dioxygenase family)
MTGSDVLAEQIEHLGYAVLGDRLTAQALAAAQREAGDLVAEADWGSGFDGSRTKRVWALLAKTRCLDQAALDPLVLETVDRLIGPGSQFGLTQATQIHPGQRAQFLHYEQGIYPLPRDRDVMVTAIWALDDFTEANGGTLVVPRSHLRTEDRPTRENAISVEMPAGSVLIFSGRLWHAGGANTSDRPRLGVIIDYVQPWLRPCEAHTLSADHAHVRELPQRLQELLGFNQASAYFGFINGQHPRDWLMKKQLGR